MDRGTSRGQPNEVSAFERVFEVKQLGISRRDSIAMLSAYATFGLCFAKTAMVTLQKDTETGEAPIKADSEFIVVNGWVLLRSDLHA